jgi:transcriptional regulator with XRE-family HTH domain
MVLSGPALRRLRLLRGIKQEHLAELLGVSQATVSRWERGGLSLSPDHLWKIEGIFLSAPAPESDAALKRLVEDSCRKVHLICDRTHRLLAASNARQAEWNAALETFLGKPLLSYASPEIIEAEQSLDAIGWREGHVQALTVETGPNDSMLLPILPGRMLWERIMLADGSTGRLVTTTA